MRSNVFLTWSILEHVCVRVDGNDPVEKENLMIAERRTKQGEFSE